jgi:hypothetical protein
MLITVKPDEKGVALFVWVDGKEVAHIVMDAPHYLNHIQEICDAARSNC